MYSAPHKVMFIRSIMCCIKTSKSSSKLNKFLHCEVSILIQHIIVQDQDGQNNNKENDAHGIEKLLIRTQVS